MKNFTKPYLAEYGKATDLIKGACGWGGENATLDKTGSKKYKVLRWQHSDAGNNTYIYCDYSTICATKPQSNECRKGQTK